MRSFIRFNGTEVSMENTLVVAPEFDTTICNMLRGVYGEDKVFAIEPVENFVFPDQTEATFMGVVTGKYEGTVPVAISVANESGPLFTVPAFLGFSK